MNKPQSHLIIIAGPGRCGTSIMIKWIIDCCPELEAGPVKWIDRYRAGYENSDVHRLLDAQIMMYRDGADMEKIKMETIDQIQAIHREYDIIKDPKFLVVPELISIWQSVIPTKVIYLTRYPDDIVASLKRVPIMSSHVFRCFPELITRHEGRFLSVVENYITVRYPDEFMPAYSLATRLRDFGIPLPENAGEILKRGTSGRM